MEETTPSVVGNGEAMAKPQMEVLSERLRYLFEVRPEMVRLRFQFGKFDLEECLGFNLEEEPSVGENGTFSSSIMLFLTRQSRN